MEVNQSYQIARTVEDQDLASSISPDPEDQFPPVFATSRLIAFMEFCSARFMKPLLNDGELSVGVGIQITHTAPTRVGEEVTITSTFTGREGKLYRFKLSAADKVNGTAWYLSSMVEANAPLEMIEQLCASPSPLSCMPAAASR